MADLPKAPIRRIVKEAGAVRVSEDATIELADILTEIGIDIAERATKLAKHAGRKTVTAEDISLASKE